MTVMITGAGMIGCQAAAALLEGGQNVILFDIAPAAHHVREIVDQTEVRLLSGDVRHLPEIIAAIKRHHVDRIIHTAAILTFGARERPYAALEVNLMGTANILEAARLSDVTHVVVSSSAAVYMDDQDAATRTQPYDEDLPLRLITDRPRTVYGITKLAAEHLASYYGEAFGFETMALRFPVVFGPWRGGTTAGFGRQIRRLVETATSGNRHAVIEYEAARWVGAEDYVYSRDAGSALALAIMRPTLECRALNITMGRPYTFHEVIDAAQRVFPQTNIEIKESPRTTAGLSPLGRQQPYDISAARSILGYEPRFDMERALRDYADWTGSE